MTGGISVKEFGVDPTIAVCSSCEVKLGRVEMRLTAGMVKTCDSGVDVTVTVTVYVTARAW